MKNQYIKYLYRLKLSRRAALELVLQQGIIIEYDTNLRNAAKSIFLKIGKVFINELTTSTLSLVYLYDQNKQPLNIAKHDGYTSISEKLNIVSCVSAIGISTRALQKGEEYTILVFLHELAHVLYNVPVKHGEEFHMHLNKLIERYNLETGSQIKNDYFGLSKPL